jgi:hypothetical protein
MEKYDQEGWRTLSSVWEKCASSTELKDQFQNYSLCICPYKTNSKFDNDAFAQKIKKKERMTLETS